MALAAASPAAFLLKYVQTTLTAKSKNGQHILTIPITGLKEGVPPVYTLKYLCDFGKPNKLGTTLKKFEKLFSRAINVYEYLETKGIKDISPILQTKTFNIGSLLNQIDSKNFLILYEILFRTFSTDPEYYDFSLGILDQISKIYHKFTPELQKYARKLDTQEWSLECYVANKIYDSKTFEDTYIGTYDPATSSIDKTIQYVIQCTCESVEPFADSFMLQPVGDAFKNLQKPEHSKFNKWKDIIMLLAWQLFDPNGSRRHPDASYYQLYQTFSQLVEEVSEYLITHGLNYDQYSHQSITNASRGASFSVGLSLERSSSVCQQQPQDVQTKCDYSKFSTYYNPYHQIWDSKQQSTKPGIFGSSAPRLILGGLAQYSDDLLTIHEISELEKKLERHIRIHLVCENIPANMQQQLTPESTFDDVVTHFEFEINKLIDQICQIYLGHGQLRFVLSLQVDRLLQLERRYVMEVHQV